MPDEYDPNGVRHDIFKHLPKRQADYDTDHSHHTARLQAAADAQKPACDDISCQFPQCMCSPSTDCHPTSRAIASAQAALASAKPANPKKAFGDKKPPLLEFPLSAQIHAAMAHLDGSLKYGYRNWRDIPVEIMTYVEAATRHLRLYENGEDLTRDTKVKNLGAVIACCAILLDAELHNSLIDNRRHSPETCDLLHKMEEQVASIKAAHQARMNK